VLCVVLVVVEAGSVVNAHFEYYRTVGEVLGEGGPDESSLAQAEREVGTIPEQGQVVPLTIPGTRSGFVARTAPGLPAADLVRPRPAQAARRDAAARHAGGADRTGPTAGSPRDGRRVGRAARRGRRRCS
jgi:hypothetical protein